jgi:protein ImuB
LPPTLLRIGLLKPSSDTAHLFRLAAIHLSTLRLPAPAFSVVLVADVADAPPATGTDLLGHKPDPRVRLAEFVERLRMRLGLDAVHGVCSRGDHRPDHAWQVVSDPFASRAGTSTPGTALRPLWMLEQPALLKERSGAPFLHGPLNLDSGPERIETGWWDGGDVRRDYYVAHNPQGTRAWVFRDCRSGRWYLHGLFG